MEGLGRALRTRPLWPPEDVGDYEGVDAAKRAKGPKINLAAVMGSRYLRTVLHNHLPVQLSNGSRTNHLRSLPVRWRDSDPFATHQDDGDQLIQNNGI